MKLRFLAVAGDPDKLRELTPDQARLADLTPVLARPALRVWTAGDTPSLRLADGSGALVGLLFRKVDGGRVAALAPRDETERPLLADHWGAYVSFRELADGHSVLRDPSGAITVYYCTDAGLHFYASDSALLRRAWPHPLTPSLDYLRTWLVYPFLRAARTGDSAVSELLPGQRRRVRRDGAGLDFCWSPFDHLPEAGRTVSFEEAAELLRRAILNSVPRFAVPGETVALQLSGGLDSSIIAAALAGSGRPFRAVTFATRAADGDERRYARLVAGHLGVEITELAEPVWTPDFGRFEAEPLRPPANPMMEPYHRAIGLDLAVHGTDIMLDGGGGDNVLGRISTAAPVLDAFRQEGAALALRTMGELAELHGCTSWTVARAVLKRARRGRVRPWASDMRFLNAGATWQPQPAHPWLAPEPRLPAGKADQLAMIVGIRHFFDDPSARWPATFHPLLSQPLLEICLAMPSWLSIRGGQERAVARRAFRGLLPDEILDRRSKGRFESIFLKGFTASRESLETFLLDGRLRANGLLDAGSVSAYLRRRGQPRDHDYLRLLEIVAAEQWLRSFDR